MKDKTTVTVVLDTKLLGKVDERAKEMDLNRSQYLRRLAKLDLEAAEAAQSTPAPQPEPAAA